MYVIETILEKEVGSNSKVGLNRKAINLREDYVEEMLTFLPAHSCSTCWTAARIIEFFNNLN